MEEKIIQIAARVFRVAPSALNLESSKDNTPNWDSFAHIALISMLEEELKIIIPIEDVPNIVKLKDFLKYQ